MSWTGTTDVLDAAGVWTSPAINVQNASSLRGIIYSDENGSLQINFGSDGENWDVSLTAIAVTGETGESFNEDILGQFVQLVYTNGGTDQTEFRLAVNTYA
jgi:hypothetical protein